MSIEDCSQISTLVGDVKQYSPSSENALFWIGLHYPGGTFEEDHGRNWFDDEYVDS